MQKRIDKMVPIMHQHILAAQAEQRHHYNCSAQSQEFQSLDRVLVLIPSTNCKFLTWWQGPFMVAECIRPVLPATAR